MTSPKSVVFECAASAAEVASRLSSARLPSRTLNPLRQGLVGTVTPTKVKLKYLGRFGIDSGLRFVGAFEAADGNCTLRGRFARPYGLLVFLWTMLSLHVIGCVAVAASANSGVLRVSPMLLGGTLLSAAVLVLHHFSERSDRRLLEKAIAGSVTGSP